MKASLYIALLHYPIQNRNGETVPTAVTNLDLHDISRTGRTYGAKAYYVVTPVEDQHGIVARILTYWKTESSKKYHPDRFEALSIVSLQRNFGEVLADITEREGGVRPEVVLTDARQRPNSVTYKDFREELWSPKREKPVLLVFGTGWGLAEEFYSHADRVLYPVFGPNGASGDYNHLSVRAAAGIILDRLFGR